MLLTELSRLRPLFLVAIVLAWNALFLTVEARHNDAVPVAAIFMLAAANLALAVIAGCVREAGWARSLAVRPEVPPEQGRAIMWLVTFVSLAAAIYGFLTIWDSMTLTR